MTELADGGGNCEYTQPGETVSVGPVTVVAPMSVPSLVAEHAASWTQKKTSSCSSWATWRGINPDGRTRSSPARRLSACAGNCDRAAQGRRTRLIRSETTMDTHIVITGIVALYIFMLGVVHRIRGHQPRPGDPHTPLMSGSNFVHGIVSRKEASMRLNASSVPEQMDRVHRGEVPGCGQRIGGHTR